jgi:hypothetical protein
MTLKLFKRLTLISIFPLASALALPSENLTERHYEAVQRGTLQVPKLKLNSTEPDYHKSKQEDPKIKNLSASLSKSDFRNEPFRLLGINIEQNIPVLTLQQNGKSYRASLAPGQIHSQISKKILNNLGFDFNPPALVKNLELDLGNISFLAFVKFWNESPYKIAFHDQFDEKSALEYRIVLKTAYLEEVVSSSTNFRASLLSSKKMLLTMMWLQCDFIDGKMESLRYCLGNSVAQSSPNYLDNYWIHRESKYTYTLENHFFDSEIRSAAVSLSKWDYDDFYSWISAFSAAELKNIFLNAGIAEKLADLYTAKLESRRFNLGLVLGKISPSMANFAGKISKIEDRPYIEHGMFKKNYPDQDVDFTKSNYELIFLSILQNAVESIEELAKYMLATLPYTGMEVGQIGQMKISPGFVARVKRTIVENQNPTGPRDLYLVKDSIEFMINIGFGVGIDKRLIGAYANAGPGYAKNYIYIRPASSIQEAKQTYWSIPKSVLLDANFENIKKNEILAIQSGFVGSALVGGGVFTGIPKTKPQGYLMNSLQFLDSFQVARYSDDKIVVTTSSDTKNILSLKLFAKLFSKFFRVPFAGINQTNGHGNQEFFSIDPKSISTNEILKKSALSAALQSGDSRLLKFNFVSTKARVDYSWTNWFLHAYFFEIRGFDNETRIEFFQNQDKSKSYEIIGSSRNFSNGDLKSRLGDGECTYSGSLELSISQPQSVNDSAMIFECNYDLQKGQAAQLMARVDSLAERLQLTASEKSILYQKIKATEGSGQLKIRGALSHNDLTLFLAEPPSPLNIREYLARYGLQQNYELKEPGDFLKRRRWINFAGQLYRIVSGNTPTDRMRTLISLLASSSDLDGFSRLILSKAQGLTYRVELSSPTDIEKSIALSRDSSDGSSPALRILKDRALLNHKSAFDSL